MYAILRDKKVIPVNDVIEWSKFFLKNGTMPVAKIKISDSEVSTVFLGIDHGFGSRPLWFETMIFGGPHDGFQKRYETYEEAEEGHEDAVALVKG